MFLNISIAVIIALFFIIASVSSKQDSKKLARMFFMYILGFIGIVALALSWGNDVLEVIMLTAIGKSGVAAGIMYGCIVGTGFGYVISLIKNQ